MTFSLISVPLNFRSAWMLGLVCNSHVANMTASLAGTQIVLISKAVVYETDSNGPSFSMSEISRNLTVILAQSKQN